MLSSEQSAPSEQLFNSAYKQFITSRFRILNVSIGLLQKTTESLPQELVRQIAKHLVILMKPRMQNLILTLVKR
jgi:hypothetical protein